MPARLETTYWLFHDSYWELTYSKEAKAMGAGKEATVVPAE
jgi:hypothetical protein